MYFVYVVDFTTQEECVGHQRDTNVHSVHTPQLLTRGPNSQPHTHDASAGRFRALPSLLPTLRKRRRLANTSRSASIRSSHYYIHFDLTQCQTMQGKRARQAPCDNARWSAIFAGHFNAWRGRVHLDARSPQQGHARAAFADMP
jgi:hypothetical protein